MMKAYLLATAGTTIRHGLSGLGVFLVAEGIADADTAQQITGGLTTVAMAGLSILRSKARL